jgi:MFS family permease
LASAALSLYWVGVILSRLLTSVIGDRVGETRILLYGSLAGSVVLLAAVLVPWSAVAISGFAVAGVVTGATLPVAMSVAQARLPERTGAVSSILYSSLALGRLVGPSSIGIVGDKLGLGVGIIIAAAVLLPVTLISAWIAASTRRLDRGRS